MAPDLSPKQVEKAPKIIRSGHGIKFSTAKQRYLAYLEGERNLSTRTCGAYNYDLDRFGGAWIARYGPDPALSAITTEQIQHYLRSLQERRAYKATTLSRTIASIRGFFKFCVREGLLETSPAAYIHNPKTPKRLPVFLVESELKRLLAAPKTGLSPTPDAAGGDAGDDPEGQAGSLHHNGKKNNERKNKFVPRDYAMLVTFGFTGLRLTELVNLSLGDVDFERKNLRVMGKGSKERIVPMNQVVESALRGWLDARPRSEDPAVFLNRFGRRISPRGVEKLVEKHVRAAGIAKAHVSPHKLRHTFATLLHVNGVDILEIQALLGHSSITSTQIYTHASSTKLQGAVRKLEGI